MKNIVNNMLHRLLEVYPEGEARALVRYVLEVRYNISIPDIYMGKDRHFSEEERAELDFIVERLLHQEPVQYILGQADFHGLTFHVAPGVLIPRPETEELVDWVLEELGRLKNATVLDVGTGSGCIAVCLAKTCPGAKVSALDVSSAALEIAHANAQAIGVKVNMLCGDILHPDGNDVLSKSSWDIIVSNPPYICDSEAMDMSKNVLGFEPHEALFVPDDNPLLFYKAIADYSIRKLNPEGKLFVEINRAYADEVMMLFSDTGFVGVELKKDMYDNNRMVKCIKPSK